MFACRGQASSKAETYIPLIIANDPATRGARELACTIMTWISQMIISTWWRHQMEAFATLLAICVGNSPVTGEFPTKKPVTRSFDVFFDLRLNKRLSKQSWGGDLRRHRAHYDVTVTKFHNMLSGVETRAVLIPCVIHLVWLTLVVGWSNRLISQIP